MTSERTRYLSRRGTRGPAEWAARERAERATPAWQARSLRHLLDHPPLHLVGDRAGLARYVDLHHPAARRVLGGAAVDAALATVVGGACRWCYADALARFRGAAPVPHDEPARLLLGEPCPTCLRGRWAALRARVDVGRPVVRPASTSTSTGRRADAARRDARAPGASPPGEARRPARLDQTRALLASAHPARACAECATYARLGIPDAVRVPHARRST